MRHLIELNQKNLSCLPEGIGKPVYDRSMVGVGIVHVGVGGFHRAHQVFYTDVLLTIGTTTDWGICGICLLERDRKMYDTLCAQDGLYTLMVKDNTGEPRANVLGALVEYLFAPEAPERAIQKMADPAVKIISLTITEGGYNFDTATGLFKMDMPDIQWDLNHPDMPKTIFGYLTAALKLRKHRALPLTILSCDNIQQNGAIAQKMLQSFMERAAPELLDWMAENVSFPNCMVDRITPVTTPEDVSSLEQNYGVVDRWPVVTEAFYQWVIEDNFKIGRPPWEKAGAQFVKHVDPYEKMKIRLINGGHSLIGLTGRLAGYHYIHEVMTDPLFTAFLKLYMETEAGPVLDPVEGVDLTAYKNQIIRRFGNSAIKDSVGRIILESSAKIPKFILPTLTTNLKSGRPIRICTTVVACWYQYLESAMLHERFNEVDDQMREELLVAVKAAHSTDPLIFLKQGSVFGDLAQSEYFSTEYLQILNKIKQVGIRKTIQHELTFPESGREI